MPRMPFPIETVDGAKALETWERIRTENRGTPVILGHDERLHHLSELLSGSDLAETVSTVERQAKAMPFPEAWREWRRQNVDSFVVQDEDDFTVTGGGWPETVTPQDFSSHLDLLTQKPLERVHIAILPTTDPTLIPAYLRFGGWNECPDASVQVAAARHWHAKYGAEIVAVTDDIVECRVRRRPATRDEAMELALEQFEFCSDIVLQGTGTLEPLAATLMTSDWWFFWWD